MTILAVKRRDKHTAGPARAISRNVESSEARFVRRANYPAR